MILSETFQLNNGIAIPKIAFGTWQIENDSVTGAVKAALSVGYRHIDTAAAYVIRRTIQSHYPVGVLFLFRPQVGNRNILAGIVTHQIPVVPDGVIRPVDNVHPFFIRHGKPVDVHHAFHFFQYIGTFLQQLGVAVGDG